MMNEHIFFNVQELHSHKFDTHKFDTHKFDTHKFDTHKFDNDNDKDNFDLDNILIDMNNSPDDDSDIYHDYLEYMNNYNVKSLTNILAYYNINKKKLVKDEMVQLIILFENELTNKNIVYERKRLWKNIIELKNNDYFKKFILF
jgi:hypothetical protein